MKKLDYRFFYYKTRAAYLSDVAYNRIPEDAIVFVEEGRYIITHGAEYKCSDDPSSPTTVIGDLLQMMFDKKQDKLTAGNGINISTDNVISATFDNLTDELKEALLTVINESIDDGMITIPNTDVYTDSHQAMSEAIEQSVNNAVQNFSISQNISNLSEEEKNALAEQIRSVLGISGDEDELIITTSTSINEFAEAIADVIRHPEKADSYNWEGIHFDSSLFDLNGDGEINVTDIVTANTLRKFALGLIADYAKNHYGNEYVKTSDTQSIGTMISNYITEHGISSISARLEGETLILS